MGRRKEVVRVWCDSGSRKRKVRGVGCLEGCIIFVFCSVAREEGQFFLRGG